MDGDHLYIQRLVALLDNTINTQLNAILHHPRFQSLEARWRGLKRLALRQAELANPLIKLRVLNASKVELVRDFRRAAEFDQSALFQLVYTKEFDHPGGEPYGLLVGDYAFSHQDTTFLHELSHVAASSFSPFIANISPELLGINHFSELKHPLELNRLFRQSEYTRWKALQKCEDTRFIGLTLPQVIMREPYQLQRDNLRFTESIRSPADQLWGNACFAYAKVIMRAFAQSGWFVDIRGRDESMQSGGVLTGQIKNTIDTLVKTTNASITSNQERELAETGLISLCDSPLLNIACFYSSHSLHLTPPYHSDIANQNNHLSSMLHYMLCVSRFTHAIKVMLRNKMGSFSHSSDIEQQLQKWLLDYCASSSDISLNLKVRYPLREAKINVTEAHTGQYRCVIHIQPHYQFEAIDAELTLSTWVNAI